MQRGHQPASRMLAKDSPSTVLGRQRGPQTKSQHSPLPPGSEPKCHHCQPSPVVQ